MKVNESIYVAPMTKVVEVNAQTIICGSMDGISNESYGEGSTDGWYNN